jgi:hypothetical protein
LSSVRSPTQSFTIAPLWHCVSNAAPGCCGRRAGQSLSLPVLNCAGTRPAVRTAIGVKSKPCGLAGSAPASTRSADRVEPERTSVDLEEHAGRRLDWSNRCCRVAHRCRPFERRSLRLQSRDPVNTTAVAMARVIAILRITVHPVSRDGRIGFHRSLGHRKLQTGTVDKELGQHRFCRYPSHCRVTRARKISSAKTNQSASRRRNPARRKKAAPWGGQLKGWRNWVGDQDPPIGTQISTPKNLYQFYAHPQSPKIRTLLAVN